LYNIHLYLILLQTFDKRHTKNFDIFMSIFIFPAFSQLQLKLTKKLASYPVLVHQISEFLSK
jgi:hypothetical protein